MTNQTQKDRRTQLSEIICEYINTDGYSGRRIYEEFISVLNAECQGREETSKKALELRDLMMGEGYFDLSSYVE